KAVPAPPPAAPPPPALAPAQSTPTQTAAAQSNAAQKAAAQKGEDERAIQNVIDRYRTAYEARNLNGIRAVFPNIGGTEGTATATNIRQAKTIQLRIAMAGTQISGDTATATVQWQMSVTIDKERFDSEQTSVRFRLGKTNGVWSIQDIDRR